jgi:hypothetical protein
MQFFERAKKQKKNALVNEADWKRSISGRQAPEILLFIKSSRLELWPTQPYTRWIPGTIFPGIKRPER